MNTTAAPSSVLLGFASSRFGDATRWSEISILREPQGYVARRIGRSVIPGETDLADYVKSPYPADVAAWFERPSKQGKRLPIVALVALLAACAADPAFSDGASRVIMAEQYGTPDPIDGSQVIMLPRSEKRNERPLRFCGRALARASSIGEGVKQDGGRSVRIYALDDGTFGYGVEILTHAGQEIYKAAVGLQPADVMAALEEHGGWPRTARRALLHASQTSEAFALGVGGVEAMTELPQSQLHIRNGEETIRFFGTRIAFVTMRVRGKRGLSIAYKKRDGGYIVGHIGVMPQPIADEYATAKDFVAAFRATNPALLDSAMKNDEEIRELVDASSVARVSPPIASIEIPPTAIEW